MVLAGDLDTPCVEVADRVVRAVVPERHLVRLAAQSQSEELVPETDAEDRRLSEDVAQVRDRLLQGRWISGTVREEETIGRLRQDLSRGCRAGHRQHRGAPVPQLLVDGAFHA